jgi:chromate transporter
VLNRQAVTDIPTVAIALVTLGVLLRLKIGEPWIVAAAAGLGLLLHWP